jgi:hypothetical protein
LGLLLKECSPGMCSCRHREIVMSESKTTLKVRIALAIDPDGDWYAYGERNAPTDEEKLSEARGWMSEDAEMYILTAEIPLPVRQVVEIEAAIEGVE